MSRIDGFEFFTETGGRKEDFLSPPLYPLFEQAKRGQVK
jgi:hypothetical protein